MKKESMSLIRHTRKTIASFRPERVLFRPGGVNLLASLCGVPLPPKGGKRNDRIMYASAQALDFLARTKNPSFPNRKLQASHPVFPDGHEPGGTNDNI